MSGEVVMPIGERPGLAGPSFLMGPEYAIQARRNHGQSLARLAERGGLGWCEAAAIVEGRRWERMEKSAAEAVVRAHLEEVK